MKSKKSTADHEAQVAESMSMVQHAYTCASSTTAVKTVTKTIGERQLLDSAASRHMQNASLPVKRDHGVVAEERIRIATGKILERPRMPMSS